MSKRDPYQWCVECKQYSCSIIDKKLDFNEGRKQIVTRCIKCGKTHVYDVYAIPTPRFFKERMFGKK